MLLLLWDKPLNAGKLAECLIDLCVLFVFRMMKTYLFGYVDWQCLCRGEGDGGESDKRNVLLLLLVYHPLANCN